MQTCRKHERMHSSSDVVFENETVITIHIFPGKVSKIMKVQTILLFNAGNVPYVVGFRISMSTPKESSAESEASGGKQGVCKFFL